MDANTVWLAIGLVLVFEGLLPFASPAVWRRMFHQILQLQDGQVRFFGLISVLGGLLMIWLMS